MTQPTAEIKALLFMPGDQPRYIAFEPTQAKINTILGGYAVQLHPVPGEKRAMACLNASSRLLEMPANTFATRRLYDILKADDYISGPVLIVGNPRPRHRPSLALPPVDVPPEYAKYVMDRCAMEASVDVPTTDQVEPSDSAPPEGS